MRSGTTKGGLNSEEALYSILKDGIIRGKGNPKHKYGYFGIAISKKSGWKAGARPVIYLPDNEANWIPENEKWRHVQYDFGKIDFTHEREWRIKGDLLLNNFGFYIIVPDRDYEKTIQDMQLNNKSSIIGFLHMNYLNDIL